MIGEKRLDSVNVKKKRKGPNSDKVDIAMGVTCDKGLNSFKGRLVNWS